MRTLLVLLFFGLFSPIMHGQPIALINLRGVVVDENMRQPLPQAIISLRSVTDSSVNTVGLTNEQGLFAIRTSSQGTYQLTVRYIGYQPASWSVVISPTRTTINLDTLFLNPQALQLQEVTVQHRPPVIIRHDTLEFDAGSFSTQPNAVVEELLGQLPGVIMTGDGVVQAQGQTVQQIFVDGKPFFGNDSKLVTRNLPAYLIAKIQIYDKRSEQSTFSGVDDGTRTRTINIITKPEGRRGQFGQQTIGYGTSGHYQAGGSINQFGQQRQISILGQINNINQAGYSLSTNSNQNATGTGGSPTLGQSAGITRSTGAGLNYSDQWGQRIDMSASYLFTQATTQAEQATQRQTVLPNLPAQPGTDTIRPILISDITTGTTAQLANHRLNTLLTYRPDTLNIIRISPGFTVYTTDNTTLASTRTLTGAQQSVNESQTDNTSVGTNMSFNNSLLWLHRFRRAGHTLSGNLSTTVNGFTGGGTNQSINKYVVPLAGQDSLPITHLNQRNTQRTQATTNELTLIYAKPLAANQAIEFRYTLFTSHNTAERLVLDGIKTTDSNITYQTNARLSNQYYSRFSTHQLAANWQLRQPRYIATLGLGVQRAGLQSIYQVGNGSLDRQYINLLPTATFQPQLVNNQYLQVQYQTHVTSPSVFQLQPVSDVTNPLFIQAGNPTLRPEFTHSVTVNYNHFQTTTYRSVFATLNVSLTNYRITTSTAVNATGVQTIRPVNANGYATANGTVSLGRSVRLGTVAGTLNLTSTLNLIRGISLINERFNRSMALTVGQGLNVRATLPNAVDISLSATLNYQDVSYSLPEQAKNKSLNMLLNTSLYYPLPFGFTISTDISFTATTGRSSGYNQQYYLWNGFISRTFFRQKQGQIRLQAYDLLNQNRSLIRTITGTYVEDIQSRVLKRYVLLSFIYNLRQFGSDK